MDMDIKLSDVSSQTSDVRFLRTFSSVLCVLAFVSGCENNSSIRTPLVEQIRNLTDQKKQLESQLEQTRAENKQLTKQIQVLSGLPDEVKGENLYNVQSVRITKYTNLYDKDKDGKKEKLIVYIQPIDEQGDVIKASGNVNVQLWDLNTAETNQSLLGQWDVKPDELKKLWFDTLIKVNYRLTFDIADKVKSFDEPLTVKVTFTDYLSGKVFNEQMVIKP